MDRIPESIQEIIKDYVMKLSKVIPVEKVILFGSYANGKQHKYSDVDIAIFSDYFKDIKRVDGIYFLLLNAMDYDIDLEPQPFTLDEYNEPVGIVSEIIRTGIEIPLPVISRDVFKLSHFFIDII
nr:nucleotidyltransferase domain-containing protein [Sedimentibacter sp.]